MEAEPAGYFHGLPVVQDLKTTVDGLSLVKSDGRWHATKEGLERLRQRGLLDAKP